MLSLGIETSCDETSVAVVKDGREVLSNVIASSLRLHKKYKGVIPEIASRAHIECVSLVCRQALETARKKIRDMDLICVTKCPGLIGSLLVGVSFAKGLSWAVKKPLIAVNHLEAHLYANFLFLKESAGRKKNKAPARPFIGLVVSGGHTNLFYAREDFTFRPLSQTLDDAAGEAFDKVARILDLGYPGGPIIEKIAKQGNPEGIKLSCAGSEGLDFSFSGIKTAVLYKAQSEKRKAKNADIAASFQKAVVDALIDKSLQCCLAKKVSTLVVGGGVSANNYFRSRLEQEAGLKSVKIYFPLSGLSLDNAAMIAGLGYQLFRNGKVSDYYLTPG